MKILLQLLIIGTILNACKSSSQNNVAYHPIVQRAKATSLFTDNVNWDEINSNFVAIAKDSNRLNESLEYLINSLGDKHATFRSVENPSTIVAAYSRKNGEQDTRDAQFTNEVINDINSRFEYQLLDDRIGYLKIVGIAPGMVEEQSNFIRDGLKKLKEQGANKWIVDLRYNGGGDMNPMIAGLAPLIGAGFIGGSVDNKNNLHQEYEIRDGQFYDNGRLVVEMENHPQISENEKVAVLLSRYTISSGELLAIAFKGRANTRFIGEQTAGYTTGNGWEQVTDELLMCISESTFIDRSRKKYDNKVGVDEVIEFAHNLKLEGDRQIASAKDWLIKI